MAKEQYALNYDPLLKQFVSKYQAATLHQNTSSMVEQTFNQINILPGASKYGEKMIY